MTEPELRELRMQILTELVNCRMPVATPISKVIGEAREIEEYIREPLTPDA